MSAAPARCVAPARSVAVCAFKKTDVAEAKKLTDDELWKKMDDVRRDYTNLKLRLSLREKV